jgi:hypothetical protein
LTEIKRVRIMHLKQARKRRKDAADHIARDRRIDSGTPARKEARFMLSSEEKSRIRAEEVFRQEIRRELEARSVPPSCGRKVWTLLNSSFALWFLSSVVIAGLTGIVTTNERTHSVQAQKADHQTRLTTEIGFRVGNGVNALLTDEQRIRAGEALSTFDVYNEGLNYLDNRVFYRGGASPEQIDYSVYAEYRDRKFRSLLFELKTAVDTSAIPELAHANARYMEVFELTSAAQVAAEQPRPQNATIEDGEKTLQILRKLEANELWRPRG